MSADVFPDDPAERAARRGPIPAGSFGAAGVPTIVECESVAPKSIVVRSEYDNAYAVIARRSEFAARIVRENSSFRDALKTVGRWIQTYLRANCLSPEDVIITGSMTREGVVVLHIEER